MRRRLQRWVLRHIDRQRLFRKTVLRLSVLLLFDRGLHLQRDGLVIGLQFVTIISCWLLSLCDHRLYYCESCCWLCNAAHMLHWYFVSRYQLCDLPQLWLRKHERLHKYDQSYCPQFHMRQLWHTCCSGRRHVHPHVQYDRVGLQLRVQGRLLLPRLRCLHAFVRSCEWLAEHGPCLRLMLSAEQWHHTHPGRGCHVLIGGNDVDGDILVPTGNVLVDWPGDHSDVRQCD